MDLDMLGATFFDFNDSLARCVDSPCDKKSPSKEDYRLENLKFTKTVHNATDIVLCLISAIIQNDKAQFLSLSRTLSSPNQGSTVDRTDVSKLLHLCCTFDSVDCATLLINGELGAVPVVNEVTAAGMSPLHSAAEALAARCVEMLLKKRARSDLKTRDGRGLLPLELSLARIRMDVDWIPDDYSVEDLVVKLGEKDLNAIKLLCEKTKELDEVVYASAIQGRVTDLAALLVVAADRVNELTIEVLDADLNSKKKATVYEWVISEALSLGRTQISLGAAKRKCSPSKDERERKRKLLLCEIELLQLFGAIALTRCADKKVAPPLVLASQAGDDVVVELLLKTDVGINDVDADGNSALHWCLKTFKGECSQHTRIMSLLMEHGARVSHKNKLGLTAVHIAAGNGNAQALKVLLLEDPDCVYSKTETKETPLFFAVRKDSKDCAELLLHYGARTDVLNLRKQRPIDLAESQDMRFLLNSTTISLRTHAVTVHQKYAVVLLADEVISDTSKELVTLINDSNTNESCSSAKTEICRYYESPTGCGRGSQCSYAHSKAELTEMKQAGGMMRSPAVKNLQRKVFVGGLPPSIDSDRLHKLFEEKFGLVDDAIVIGEQTGDKIQSRGFGFVTFRHKKSVSAAVEAHYITIMGRQTEIKSAVPKSLLLHLQGQSNKHSPLEQKNAKEIADRKMLTEKTKTGMPSPQISSEKTETEVPSHNTTEEPKPKQMSWVETLINGQPKPRPCKDKETRPKWLIIFKKWLPNFLQRVAKRDQLYALSSLKADFKAAFGLELDHASLGFQKLSDFMRSFPDLCRIKFAPLGSQQPANHMILLPSILQIISPPSSQPSEYCSDSDSCQAKSSQGVSVASTDIDDLVDTSSKGSNQNSDAYSKETPISENTFLKLLEPDSDFNSQPSQLDECDGNTSDGEKSQNLKGTTQRQHVALELLAKKRNNTSVYFLREFDFFENYKRSMIERRCFGCNQRRVLWACFPCKHLLWCGTCCLEVARAVNGFEHKCVLCDTLVQKMDLIS